MNLFLLIHYFIFFNLKAAESATKAAISATTMSKSKYWYRWTCDFLKFLVFLVEKKFIAKLLFSL